MKKRGHKENRFEISTLRVAYLVLHISLKLSFCLGFKNLNNQTTICTTLQCVEYKVNCVPYKPQPSTSETSNGRGPM